MSLVGVASSEASGQCCAVGLPRARAAIAGRSTIAPAATKAAESCGTHLTVIGSEDDRGHLHFCGVLLEDDHVDKRHEQRLKRDRKQDSEPAQKDACSGHRDEDDERRQTNGVPYGDGNICSCDNSAAGWGSGEIVLDPASGAQVAGTRFDSFWPPEALA